MKLVSLLPLFALLVACADPVPEPATAPAPTAATAPVAPVTAPAAHHEGHDHAAAAPTDGATAPADHDGTAAELKVPTSLPAIITEIEVRSKKMREQVRGGSLAGVHPLSAEVRKLAITLPSRAAGRSAAELADITLAATQAKDQADAAHHAADQGDAAAALAALDGLDAAIVQLNKVQR